MHCRDGAGARRALYDGLKERGIFAQVHYVPVYRHPYYRETYGYERGLCPEAEGYYAGCLSLPCFPALTEAEQDRVVDAVKEVLAHEPARGVRPRRQADRPRPPDVRDRRGRGQPQPRHGRSRAS